LPKAKGKKIYSVEERKTNRCLGRIEEGKEYIGKHLLWNKLFFVRSIEVYDNSVELSDVLLEPKESNHIISSWNDDEFI